MSKKTQPRIKNDLYRCGSKYHIDDRYLTIDSFNKRKANPHGISTMCRSCEKQCRINRADKIKVWIDKNRDKIRAYGNIYKKQKKQNDPAYRMRNNISKIIQNILRDVGSSKKGYSFFDYLDYDYDQLKSHIENQFDKCMNWDNYGKPQNGGYWNLDHIIPQTLLHYDSCDHINFRICWDLENIRPLEQIANIKKHNNLSPASIALWERLKAKHA